MSQLVLGVGRSMIIIKIDGVKISECDVTFIDDESFEAQYSFLFLDGITI
jgi:hypothetical protein